MNFLGSPLFNNRNSNSNCAISLSGPKEFICTFPLLIFTYIQLPPSKFLKTVLILKKHWSFSWTSESLHSSLGLKECLRSRKLSQVSCQKISFWYLQTLCYHLLKFLSYPKYILLHKFTQYLFGFTENLLIDFYRC